MFPACCPLCAQWATVFWPPEVVRTLVFWPLRPFFPPGVVFTLPGHRPGPGPFAGFGFPVDPFVPGWLPSRFLYPTGGHFLAHPFFGGFPNGGPLPLVCANISLGRWGTQIRFFPPKEFLPQLPRFKDMLPPVGKTIVLVRPVILGNANFTHAAMGKTHIVLDNPFVWTKIVP